MTSRPSKAKSYTARDITVLEGLDPVRKRPGMYIGGVGSSGLHHLVWEVLDNAVDEAMNGFASEISLTLHRDGTSVTVTDNGRGIPVDKHPKTGKPALEVILTTLHAGGKFDAAHGGYKTAGGLHGVGASVVNALSKQMTATVRRDGACWQMQFKGGRTVGRMKKTRASRGTGTMIFFHPDPTIFPRTEFNPQLIRERLEVISYLHQGVNVTFRDEVNGTQDVFRHAAGLSDYLGKIIADRGVRVVHEVPFYFEKDSSTASAQGRVQVILQWTEGTEEYLRSYVNGIPTGSGGTHENGLRAGLGKAVRNYIETHKLVPRGVNLNTDDLREGLHGVLSVFLSNPQFQGQTKDRLNNPELQAVIDGVARPALEHWLNHNRTVAEAVVARIILAAKAREASRAASQEITRKSAISGRLNLPGKLTDCTASGSAESELFIVEGDSAGGSAKQARNRTLQAVLPLRGKVLNVESASLRKVLENRELADIVTALGCGLGKHFDPARLRYDRIVLLMDADSDGHHITTLLLTFIYRHMPDLIRLGKVYLAQPPLYRIDIGKQTYWAQSDEKRDAIVSKHGGRGNPEITRFKGLGEMMPKTLWETTLDPARRQLLRVSIEDPLHTERVISDLMGKDPSARFAFIMERAEEAGALDV